MRVLCPLSYVFKPSLAYLFSFGRATLKLYNFYLNINIYFIFPSYRAISEKISNYIDFKREEV